MKIEDDFIGKHIKRTKRNLLLINIPIVVVIFLLWVNNAFSEDPVYWKLIMLGLFILACRNIVLFWKRNKNPSLHPINKRISRFGPLKDLVAILNKEVIETKSSLGKVIITESWLLKPSFFDLEIVHLGELAWAYNNVTTHYTNGVKTGTSITTVIYKVDGKRFEIAGNQFNPNLVINAIMSKAPWVICGYSDELKTLWNSKNSEFFAAVAQKKREVVKSR